MTDINPYKQYTEDNVLNSNPLGLVIALYEGALDASINARACFARGDIHARTKSINKLVSILTELTSSLDHTKGGEVSQNLDRLYNYIQRRAIDAHIQQNPAHLDEVERLLTTMLEGWREAKASFQTSTHYDVPAARQVPAAATAFAATSSLAAAPHAYAEAAHSEAHYSYDTVPVSHSYGGYMGDYGDLAARQAYSF